MRTRLLATEGKGEFVETLWEKPNITDDEISVKAVLTGVCRSDIDMMQGNFGPLPLHMQGHEGLAQVIEVGKNITNVKPGDFVATRGEPAYADFYNVRKDEYVPIESADPKYILEPVACGVNLIEQDFYAIKDRSGPGKRLLILGSGFLAWVAYHTIKFHELEFEITVKGKSNKDMWNDLLSDDYEGTFDVIIDLNSGDDVFSKNIVNSNALVIFGTQKTVTTDFGNLLWKACTIVFPSPRDSKFIECMYAAEFYVRKNYINVDKFWTNCYNRNTEWQKAFQDGINRPVGYSRGYIKWD